MHLLRLAAPGPGYVAACMLRLSTPKESRLLPAQPGAHAAADPCCVGNMHGSLCLLGARWMVTSAAAMVNRDAVEQQSCTATSQAAVDDARKQVRCAEYTEPFIVLFSTCLDASRDQTATVHCAGGEGQVVYRPAMLWVSLDSALNNGFAQLCYLTRQSLLN